MSPRRKTRAKAGYMISSVAELYKLHPQTLRLYERVGLLTRDMGVNLAGIEIILNMREKMLEMEKQMSEFATVVQQELSRVANHISNEKPSQHAIVPTRIRLTK